MDCWISGLLTAYTACELEYWRNANSRTIDISIFSVFRFSGVLWLIYDLYLYVVDM